MVTSKDALVKYGDPIKEKSMIIWDVPTELEIGVIPKKIYCNKDMVEPLKQAFKNIIDRGLIKELKTWDGCFNIRKKTAGKSASLHSWGIACDLNASWNGYNKKPTLSKKFVQCFKDVGFDWGGDWKIKDGMHFELNKI